MRPWLIGILMTAVACGGGGDRGVEGGTGGGGVAGSSAGSGGRGGASGGTAGGAAGNQGGAGSGGVAGVSQDAAAHDAGPADAATTQDTVMASPDASPAAAIKPTRSDGRFRFEAAGVALEIDPQIGGRVTLLSSGGKNILTGPAVNPLNWGSTFWPSPQKGWNAMGWPPPKEIDSDPYVVMGSSDSLLLQGPKSPEVNLSVQKRFAMDAAGIVTISYTVKNEGTASTKTAPWEITRVAAGGLTFFALGAGGIKSGNVPFEQQKGAAWYAFDPTKFTGSLKSFADGKGWLAFVDTQSKLLYVKAFPDLADSDAAPGEAEIEVFVNDKKDYIELEPQGAYRDLAAGASATWTVRWTLRPLPAGTSVAVGSQALLDLVASIIK